MDKDKLVQKVKELLQNNLNDQFFQDISHYSDFDLISIEGNENEGQMKFKFDFNYWLTNESVEADYKNDKIDISFSEEWNIELIVIVNYSREDNGYLVSKQHNIEGKGEFINLDDEIILNEENEQILINDSIEPVDFINNYFEKYIKDNSGLAFINSTICSTNNMIDDFSTIIY